MKRVVLIFCLLFYLLFSIFYLPPILAVDSSPSTDLKSKLKILQEEIASRAANMKTEVAKKLQNKAYIGVIKDKNNTSITLSVKENSKNININEFTEYIIKSKTYTGAEGLKNITADNTIAALGDIDDNGVLTAKRVIKLNTPLPTPKKIIYGTVVSITDKTVILKTAQNDQFSITFDKKTAYQMDKSAGSFTDIKATNWLIVVAEQSNGNDKTLQAKFVYNFIRKKSI